MIDRAKPRIFLHRYPDKPGQAYWVCQVKGARGSRCIGFPGATPAQAYTHWLDFQSIVERFERLAPLEP